MRFFTADERDTVHAVAALVECNPFLPERVELERRILGRAFVDGGPVWSAGSDDVAPSPNTPLLHQRLEELATTLRERLAEGAEPNEAECAAYRGFVLYLLWLRFEDEFWELIEPGPRATAKVAWYSRFAREAAALLSPLPGPPPDIPHLFALGFQFRRAFHHIFRSIYGSSLPIARLRAAVWESIFTADQALYRRRMFEQMWQIPVMITGETGTGKDLVASAIGLSPYVPFDARKKRFVTDPHASFVAINLSELNPSLIESELFGHVRGSFTGADKDKHGRLLDAGPHGVVFLDEIGEVGTDLQVKLLRVLQNREVTPVGASEPRRFEGRLITATNRDVEREVDEGRLREDFYFRVCVDHIRTPSLRQQIADSPDDLRHLVSIVARKLVGEEDEPAATERVVAYIDEHLRDCEWAGNMRELERCVKGIVAHHTFAAPRRASAQSSDLLQGIEAGAFSSAELEERYVEILMRQNKTMREIARITGRDPRTLARIVEELHKKKPPAL